MSKEMELHRTAINDLVSTIKHIDRQIKSCVGDVLRYEEYMSLIELKCTLTNSLVHHSSKLSESLSKAA
jgi:hypothetical protein